MHRVIYSSRATRYFTPQGIEALNYVCRRNNAALGLSGLLLYHEGRFFQVLEGNDEALLQVMQAITKDERHMDLRLAEHGPIEARSFQGWRMGYEVPLDQPKPSATTLALQDLLRPDSQDRGRDPKVRNHLRSFLATLRQLPRAAAG